MNDGSGARVAVVAGLRTPFAKQGTVYARLSAVDLGRLVVAELLARSGLGPLIERLVYGQVIPSPRAPNIAREVVLGAGLGPAVDAYSVSRACATSYQTTVDLALAIRAGEIRCGLAGGAESASDVPILVSKPLGSAIVKAGKARSLGQRLAAFKGIRAKDIVPVPPALKEPSSDYTMGEAAEKMARENGIARQAQDQLAHQSHRKAARAWAEGVFAGQVMRAYLPPDGQVLAEDNLPRKDSSPADYAKLKPVFDRRYGTVTAANSSPLTDGAGALILMAEDQARAEGLPVLGTLVSHAFTALDPNWQMLMGPAFATPLALERAGMDLKDLELIDMHEAFAAQVLSNLQAFASARFARERLGRDRAIGEIDPERLNVSGGSIALGHPFAATGARQILQLCHDLKRRGGGRGLATACAAGGLGAALIVEVDG